MLSAPHPGRGRWGGAGPRAQGKCDREGSGEPLGILAASCAQDLGPGGKGPGRGRALG